MTNANKKNIYVFGEFKLDPSKLMLYKAGNEVPLPPRAVETLIVLVENRGQIVPKDDLMNTVWNETAVEESNLSQYLYLLRRALGRQPGGKPFIETLRRRGYRFTGEVSVSNEAAPAAAVVAAVPGQQAAHQPRVVVEKRGNVLKLAEWQATPEPRTVAPEALPERDRARTLTTPSRLNVWVAVIVISVVVGLASLVYFLGPGQAGARSAARGDLTFTRLTDGIVPTDAAISLDGKYFAYTEYTGESSRMLVQQTGQANRLEIVPFGERSIAGKTFSPDSQFIYFIARQKDDEHTALYRIPTLGGPEERLLTKVDSPVSFSPDGAEMIFHRRDPKIGASALVIASSDGRRERIVQSRQRGQEILSSPAWSPDGENIAFSALPTDGPAPNACQLKKLNLRTGDITLLSPETWGACFRIAWTQDSEGIILVGTKMGEWLSTRRENIFYVSARTGEARRLTVDGNRYQLYSLGVTKDDAILALIVNERT